MIFCLIVLVCYLLFDFFINVFYFSTIFYPSSTN